MKGVEGEVCSGDFPNSAHTEQNIPERTETEGDRAAGQVLHMNLGSEQGPASASTVSRTPARLPAP